MFVGKGKGMVGNAKPRLGTSTNTTRLNGRGMGTPSSDTDKKTKQLGPPKQTPNIKPDSYGVMPGSKGKEWEPTFVLKDNFPKGAFGYYDRETKEIGINKGASGFLQNVFKVHETAHAAHHILLSLDDAEEFLLSELVAHGREALEAINLDKQGKGPADDDEMGQLVLRDAYDFQKDRKKKFLEYMLDERAPYLDQIAELLRKAGSKQEVKDFIIELVGNVSFKKPKPILSQFK